MEATEGKSEAAAQNVLPFHGFQPAPSGSKAVASAQPLPDPAASKLASICHPCAFLPAAPVTAGWCASAGPRARSWQCGDGDHPQVPHRLGGRHRNQQVSLPRCERDRRCQESRETGSGANHNTDCSQIQKTEWQEDGAAGSGSQREEGARCLGRGRVLRSGWGSSWLGSRAWQWGGDRREPRLGQ